MEILKRILLPCTILLLILVMTTGCDGFLELTNYLQPGLVDIIELDYAEDDKRLICAYDGKLYAALGTTMYVIDEDGFSIDEEYEYYFRDDHDNWTTLKASETSAEEFILYTQQSDNIYFLDEDNDIVRKKDIVSLGSQDLDSDCIAYMAWDGTDLISGYTTEDGRLMEWYVLGTDISGGRIEIPDDTRIINMEAIGDYFYVVAVPVFGEETEGEPLDVHLGVFEMDDADIPEEYDSSYWTKTTIVEQCSYTEEDNNGDWYPGLNTSITAEGIMIYDIDSSFDEPNTVFLDFNGNITGQMQCDNGTTGCVSSTGGYCYFLSKRGVFKYELP